MTFICNGPYSVTNFTGIRGASIKCHTNSRQTDRSKWYCIKISNYTKYLGLNSLPGVNNKRNIHCVVCLEAGPLAST